MSLVPNEGLRYRSDYPGDTRCADCSDCKCRKEVEAETVQRCIDEVMSIAYDLIDAGGDIAYWQLKERMDKLREAQK